MTLRLLAALARLRWRILVNSLTRAGKRDAVERLSRALESVIPIAIVVLLVPAAVTLAGLGGWTGLQLGRGAPDEAFALQVVRAVLMGVLALTVAGPALVSGANHGPGLLRLLLLPIPTRLLYVAHAVGALADPWIFLCVPLLLGVTAGLAASGALVSAAVSLLAGLALLVVLLGIAALSSATLQLVVRDRRRAELVVLLGTLLIVIASLLPSALIPTDRDEDRRSGRPRRDPEVPGWLVSAGRALPSHLYAADLESGETHGRAGGRLPLAGLFAWALAMHGLSWHIYRRLLVAPTTSGPARRARASGMAHTVPGMPAAVSAVAVAFVRLGFRTPRGRSVVLMPMVMLGVFAGMALLRGESIPFGPIHLGGGYSLGIFGVALALLSLSPLSCNQFAVDRAGLTLQFLAPISARELLYGKALGGAALAAIPCAVAVLAGLVTGGGSLALWAALALGAYSVYALLAPVAAVLSMLLPRSVDLSSIGSASNAHQAAGLLGVLAFGLAAVPPAALAWGALRWVAHPIGAPLAVAAWAAAATGAALAGFRLASRLLEQRRENLAMVAAGR